MTLPIGMAAKDSSPGLERADADALIDQAIERKEYRRAMGVCARVHGPALGRLCMAFTGVRAEADELVQETLLAAHDSFGSFRRDGTVRAWLFGIARRLCAKHVAARPRPELRLRLVHDASRGPGADDLLMQRQLAERARAALDALGPHEREAVVLRYQAGLSFREIAEACSIDEATARKRVSRALGRLRAALVESERVGGDGCEDER
jgi:RNA polymerase sigma-70 factor, ECF subfamily